MSTWVNIILGILRLLLPVVLEKAGSHMEEGDPQTELAARLRQRIRETWGRVTPVVLCLVVLVGCSTRTIYVPDGAPVRLRETIKDAKVWVLNKEVKQIPGVMDLPEGWFALPPEPVSPEKGD